MLSRGAALEAATRRCAFQGNRNGNHQTSFPDCRGPCLCSISYWGFRLEPEVNDEEIERTGRQKDVAAVKPLSCKRRPKRRNEDASKKNVATKIFVFDFELFIGILSWCHPNYLITGRVQTSLLASKAGEENRASGQIW